MKTSSLLTIAVALSSMAPEPGWSQSMSSVIPVMTGAYATADGGCDGPAAAFLYVNVIGLGANKTKGKIVSAKREGSLYRLEVLWVESGDEDADGERGSLVIEPLDDRTFNLSASGSEPSLMRLCD